MIESNDPVTESRRLLEESEIILESCRRTIADFLNVELKLSTTFAQTALNSFAAGKIEKARRTRAAAFEARATIRKLLPRLTADERQVVEAKLATSEPLFEQLAEIK